MPGLVSSPQIEALFPFGNGKWFGLISSDATLEWFAELRKAPFIMALLDPFKGGTWQIKAVGSPVRSITSSYSYGSNVVRTTVNTERGTLVVTDFVPVGDYYGSSSPVLVRRVECICGSVNVEQLIKVTPGFANPRTPTPPSIVPMSGQLLLPGEAGTSIGLAICTSASLLERTTFVRTHTPGEKHDPFIIRTSLREGQCLSVCMFVGRKEEVRSAMDKAQTSTPIEHMLSESIEYWNRYIDRYKYNGYRRQNVRRAVLLKALLRYPSGASAAAATTSLPETIGGSRNWDYRFSWLRDSAFSAALDVELGFYTEAEAFLSWLLKRGRVENWQVMYGLNGERNLPERLLVWLSGYKKSRPVRTGNAAKSQKQLDLYGEVALFLITYIRVLGYHHGATDLLWQIADYVCEHHDDPDQGIWEIRGPGKCYTYSQACCWGALKWAIEVADLAGTHEVGNGVRTITENVKKWRSTMGVIHQKVFEGGVDHDRGSFKQTVGEGTALDASLLLLPKTEIVQPTDEVYVKTVRRIMSELTNRAGFVLRYQTGYDEQGNALGVEEFLVGQEGGFVACHFWAIWALAESGQLDEAREQYEAIMSKVGPSGSIAEMVTEAGMQLGNTPQLYSLDGCIEAALAIQRALERKDVA